MKKEEYQDIFIGLLIGVIIGLIIKLHFKIKSLQKSFVKLSSTFAKFIDVDRMEKKELTKALSPNDTNYNEFKTAIEEIRHMNWYQFKKSYYYYNPDKLIDCNNSFKSRVILYMGIIYDAYDYLIDDDKFDYLLEEIYEFINDYVDTYLKIDLPYKFDLNNFIDTIISHKKYIDALEDFLKIKWEIFIKL